MLPEKDLSVTLQKRTIADWPLFEQPRMPHRVDGSEGTAAASKKVDILHVSSSIFPFVSQLLRGLLGWYCWVAATGVICNKPTFTRSDGK